MFGNFGGGITEPKLFWNEFGNLLCAMVLPMKSSEARFWHPGHKPETVSKNPVWISEFSYKARLGVSKYRVQRNALLVQQQMAP